MTATCLLFGALGYAEDYQVRLERPFKPGDVLGLVAKAGQTRTERVSAGDKVVEENASALKAHLEAEMEILAVNKKGRMTRAALTVHKFSGSIDGKAAGPIAPGSVVVATSAADKTAFQLKDKQLPGDVQRLLGMLIEAHKESDLDEGDDEVFGTSARKKVGEKWPINKAAIIKSLTRQELSIKEGDLSGTVRITELRKVNGVSCLHVAAEVNAVKFSPPLGDGAKVLGAKITTRMIGDFPVDVTLPRLRDGLILNIAMEIQMPAKAKGQAKHMEISSSSWVMREYTPVRQKPDPAVAAILAKLELAKADHAKALAKARKTLLAAIESQFEAALSAGDLESVTHYQKVKDTVQTKGTFPPGQTNRKLVQAKTSFETSVRSATFRLANAYGTAVAECTKAGDLARAEAMQVEIEKRGLATAAGVSYRLGDGFRWPPYLERRSGMFVAVKGGIATKDRVYIRTKSGDFLNKDFIFEVVFEGAQDHDTAFFGLGEARPGREYGEPAGSVNLRIRGPGERNGTVTVTKAGRFASKAMGNIPKPGTHRARIHKKGPTVTFSIDVDNDGPSSNDFSKKIPDIKAFATFLNDKNFHLFFGSGAKVTYKEVRLVLLH